MPFSKQRMAQVGMSLMLCAVARPVMAMVAVMVRNCILIAGMALNAVFC